jgi:hypothetical protein
MRHGKVQGEFFPQTKKTTPLKECAKARIVLDQPKTATRKDADDDAPVY